jgi:hypothetical protein
LLLLASLMFLLSLLSTLILLMFLLVLRLCTVGILGLVGEVSVAFVVFYVYSSSLLFLLRPFHSLPLLFRLSCPYSVASVHAVAGIPFVTGDALDFGLPGVASVCFECGFESGCHNALCLLCSDLSDNKS